MICSQEDALSSQGTTWEDAPPRRHEVIPQVNKVLRIGFNLHPASLYH